MNKGITMKSWLLAISLMILGGGMSACAGGSAKWKEEVQLSDGQIIVVERETIRERGGDEWASNRSGSKPKEYHIRFASPEGSGKMIEWRSIKETDTWPEIPLVLDMEDGHPVVFTSVFTSGGGQIYSKYAYQNNAWREELLPEKFAQRASNLLIFDPKGIPKFIDLRTKRQMNSDSAGSADFMQVGPTRRVRAR
jgi:hypothetical protein